MKPKVSKKNTTDTTFATFPSIRGKMGRIEYFIATMTLADVAVWIKKPKQTGETDSDFKTWLQREIEEKRLAKIVDYLSERDDRFFNSIVVGIFGGNPNWYPVSISVDEADDLVLDDRAQSSVGIIKLSGGEEVFSIDGQHRVEGIKEALKSNTKIANDELAVIFIAHYQTAAGRKQTRRLFSTLNKYAKPVSRGEIVALDEDDAFAIVTRQMTDKYRPLRGLITYSKTANLSPKDEVGVTTTVGLYELLRILPRTSKTATKKLEDGPSEHHEQQIKELYDTGTGFWDALISNIPAVARVLGSAPSKKLAGKARANGGNMLFRPAGQQAFAKAMSVMVKSGMGMSDAISRLSKLQLDISKAPWPGVMWHPSRKTMILVRKPMMYNMLLHMVGSPLSPPDFDLLKQYREALNDDNAVLPTP